MDQATQQTQQATNTGEGGQDLGNVRQQATDEGQAGEPQGQLEGNGEVVNTEPLSKRAKTDAEVPEETEVSREPKSVALPSEMWLMIGEHVDPLDLLHLTRVTKALRRLFRSKQDSARTWKLAFKNIDLPPLKATDWDLIYLTSLIHENCDCIACGSAAGPIKRDYACRLFRHRDPSCGSKIFSTVAEIDDQVNVLHADTLSCVPSILAKEGRKTEAFYVTSQVKPMNDYLLYLDSTTSASRDRNVRKAAREARDSFIAQKKSDIAFRFEDEETLEVWEPVHARRQQLALEKRRRAEQVQAQAERDAKAARTRERCKDIRARLLALGYINEDLEWLSRDPVAAKDRVLTESEWNDISSGLTSAAHIHRQERIITQRAASRAVLTVAYFSYFEKRTEGRLNLSSYCSKQRFGRLPTVLQLASAGTAIGDPLWIQLLPTLQQEMASVRLAKKLAYARPLAQALADAGHPLPSDFVASLHPSGSSPNKSIAWRIPVDFDKIPTDDSPISEEQVDELLSRFTSRAFVGYFDRHQLDSFSVVDSLRQRYTHRSGVSVSAEWIRCLFAILEAANIEDGEAEATEAKLDAQGVTISCKKANHLRVLRESYKFSEFVDHICLVVSHVRALNPHYHEGSFTSSDLAIVSRPPVASSSTTS